MAENLFLNLVFLTLNIIIQS